MRIFISYSHQQGPWVMERLVPCLEAGGAEVLIDRQRFKVGKSVIGQMDEIQDQADKHVLVLSPDYLSSDYCKHELERALKCDPKFEHGVVLPVLRLACEFSACFGGCDPPLCANLQDDSRAEAWSMLLEQCEATGLGSTPPAWLAARDALVRHLNRGSSVNLVVQRGVNWRGLLQHVVRVHLPDLVLIDLQNPATTSRYGLLSTIGKALGSRIPLAKEPHDLAAFQALLEDFPVPKVGLINFDLAVHRPYYDVDLFASLRYLIMETRKLVLMVQSRTPFGALLPRDHPLSDMNMTIVELRAEP